MGLCVCDRSLWDCVGMFERLLDCVGLNRSLWVCLGLCRIVYIDCVGTKW